MKRKSWIWVFILVLCVGVANDAEARRRRRAKRYTGPPPTHPVILWSRTLSGSTDREQRKVAAFKLSQYTQTLYQDSVVNVLLKCMKDPDLAIRVLCTKAMGRAGTKSHTESIRKALLEQYASEEQLKSTVVRAFIVRKDIAPNVQEKFMDALEKSKNTEDTLTLLSYFEKHGNGSKEFVDSMVKVYNGLGTGYSKKDELKLRRAVVKVLTERAEGQDAVVDLVAQCSQSSDTPLALICLGGLQTQAKKDGRAWSAVEKTVKSDDPDVLMASLDVINSLPESPNRAITPRLVELAREVEDTELQEKAVLALGICGDQSESVVESLIKLLEAKGTDEGVRIASALVLGKQCPAFAEKPKELLTNCSKSGSSQSFRTACQLGMQELEVREKKEPKPASVAAKEEEKKRETQSTTTAIPKAEDLPEKTTSEPPASEVMEKEVPGGNREPQNSAEDDEESDEE